MAYTRCECGGNNLNPCYHCQRQQQAYKDYHNNLQAHQPNVLPYNAADPADRDAHIRQFNAELARQQYCQGQGEVPPNNQQPGPRHNLPPPPQVRIDPQAIFDARMDDLYRRYGDRNIDRVIRVLVEAGAPVTPDAIQDLIDRARRQRERQRGQR